MTHSVGFSFKNSHRIGFTDQSNNKDLYFSIKGDVCTIQSILDGEFYLLVNNVERDLIYYIATKNQIQEVLDQIENN